MTNASRIGTEQPAMKPTTHTAFRPHRRNAARAFLPKRLVFVFLGIAAYLAARCTRSGISDWTEQAYSHVAYPVLSSIAGFLPSLVRFSVAEWVALLFVLFCLWYVVHVVRAIVKGGRAAAMRPDTAGPSTPARRPGKRRTPQGSRAARRLAPDGPPLLAPMGAA